MVYSHLHPLTHLISKKKKKGKYFLILGLGSKLGSTPLWKFSENLPGK